ncbi:phosphoglucomutase/phosphomannomutase, alpha/beta/alpha domain II family protein [Mycobacterium xenopi 4042]|uniref:Phosphoglucomutase/phosphomannomutase, alpha/beta/alpha domain II family protein n=1 Tax=Mycobacterium xenopi 4042 TaxID=1299334 RepID=X8DBS1_MYCXE|nr:phosphoglucomutase/phosphomannomutase, alpha/beta/alpha domain II family protein [Mycobacterium xenopi 4042]
MVGHDMRESSPALAAALPPASPVRVSTWSASACPPPISSISRRACSTAPAQCSPPVTTRRHTTASRCVERVPSRSARHRAGHHPRRTHRRVPGYDGPPGSVTDRDVLADYGAFLRSLVNLSDLRPLRVAVDAGNGMAAHTAPAVFAPVESITLLPLYFELDGSFPHHEANPLDPANLVDLQQFVVDQGADIGLAFDGDADRCFVVDECGQRCRRRP